MLNGVKVGGVGWLIKERHTSLCNPRFGSLRGMATGVILLAYYGLPVLVPVTFVDFDTLPEVIKHKEDMVAIGLGVHIALGVAYSRAVEYEKLCFCSMAYGTLYLGVPKLLEFGLEALVKELFTWFACHMKLCITIL